MKIEIHEIAKLKASLVCAAKTDIRSYLNGVFVEVHAEHILLVSTDGHRLSVIRSKFIETSMPHNATGTNFIIPREAIESFIKIAGKNTTATIEFDTQRGGEVDRVHFALSDSQGHKIEGKAIDGRFPDWRRIIPSQPRDADSDATVSYNASYVSDFGKIAEILGNKDRRINLTEYSGHVLKVSIGNEDFLGVLMGCRNPIETNHSWLV